LCATSVAVSPAGDVYLADNDDYLRLIDPSGIIRRIWRGAVSGDPEEERVTSSNLDQPPPTSTAFR
jgi:hypothetical protein